MLCDGTFDYILLLYWGGGGDKNGKQTKQQKISEHRENI